MEGQKIYFLNSLETKYIYIFGDEKQNSINLRDKSITMDIAWFYNWQEDWNWPDSLGGWNAINPSIFMWVRQMFRLSWETSWQTFIPSQYTLPIKDILIGTHFTR